jgi:hypothetical protein
MYGRYNVLIVQEMQMHVKFQLKYQYNMLLSYKRTK